MATRTLAVPVGDREVEVDLHTDTASAVAALARFVEAAGRYDDFKVGLDTETDSSKLEYTVKNPGPLRTIQVAGSATVEDGSRFTRALVLDMRDVDVTEIAPLLVQLPAYVWNIDFDYYVLAREGVWLQDVRDLLYTDLLLRNGKTGAYYRGLAVAARQYLGVEIGGKGTTQVSYDSHSDLSDEQISYAGLDAVVTVDLATPLEEAIAASGQETANELEWRASRGRMVMQLRGIGFELDRYTEALFDVEERRDAALARMAQLCGRGRGTLDLGNTGSSRLRPPFNPDSPAQVLEALNTYAEEDLREFFAWYDPVFLPSWARSGGGERKLGDHESADSQTLTLIVNQTGNELVSQLLEYRKWAQVLKNFSDETFAEFAKVDPTTGRHRIHGTFTQLGTETGRWSSKDPNMQNQPKFTKPFFTPDPGKLIVQADYSSAEIALVAYLAGDESVAEPFHLKRLAARAVPFNTGGLTADSGADRWKLVASQMRAGGADLGRYADLDVDALAERLQAAHGVAADPHGSTALKMFGSAEGDNRKAAKGVNFGINYGQGPRALALGLTERGTITTPDVAKEHLEKHAKAHPGLAAYLQGRDEQIAQIANNPVACDWKATFELWNVHRDLTEVGRELTDLPYKPGPDDFADKIVELLDAGRDLRAFHLPEDGGDGDRDTLRAQFEELVAWAQRFDGAIVLQALTGEEQDAGVSRPTTPVGFASATVSGRLRYYQLPTTSILTSLATTLGTGKSGTMRAQLREQFAQEHGLTLSRPGRGSRLQPLSRDALKRRLADKDVLYQFVKFVLSSAPAEVQHKLLADAYRDVVMGHRNRFRNHGVQGGVGDIVEAAIADIADMLDEYPGAWLVCTVHDSIVAEVPEEFALEVADRMTVLMIDAFERFAPTVPSSVDADICWTYDERDALSDAELAELRGKQQPKPAATFDPASVPIAA